MNAESNSGWVPDKLPDFNKKEVPVVVLDTRLVNETRALARYFSIEPTKLGKNFLRLGITVANFQKTEQYQFVARDSMGNREVVDFMAQELSPNVLETLANEKKKSSGFSSTEEAKIRKLIVPMPGNVANEFMEIANRNNTTVDEIIKKMFILGINFSRNLISPQKNFFIEDKLGEDAEIVWF